MSTPTRKRLTAPERREQIVEASAGVIVRHGVHAFRLRDVADAAGISQPLVSVHFRSRDELIVAAFEMSDVRAFDEVMLLAELQEDGRSRVVTCITESIGVEEQRAQSWDLWLQLWSYGQFSEPVRQVLEARQRAWVDLVTRFIEEGQSDGSVEPSLDPHRVAQLLVTAIDGVSSSLRCRVLSDAEAKRICIDTMDATLLPPRR